MTGGTDGNFAGRYYPLYGLRIEDKLVMDLLLQGNKIMCIDKLRFRDLRLCDGVETVLQKGTHNHLSIK